MLHDFAQRLGVEGVLEEELRGKTRERGYGAMALRAGQVPPSL